MANHINMGEREAIARLYEGGWKKRRIARELGLDRKTVRRHILALERSKGTLSPAGDVEAKGTILHAGKSMRPGGPAGANRITCFPFRGRGRGGTGKQIERFGILSWQIGVKFGKGGE